MDLEGSSEIFRQRELDVQQKKLSFSASYPVTNRTQSTTKEDRQQYYYLLRLKRGFNMFFFPQIIIPVLHLDMHKDKSNAGFNSLSLQYCTCFLNIRKR